MSTNISVGEHGLYYGVRAPFIAYFGLMLFGSLYSIVEAIINERALLSSFLQMFMLTAFFGLFVAYIIGFIPAFITGMLVNRFAGTNDQVLSAGVAGCSVTFLSILLVFQEPVPAIWLAIIGGLSGVLCEAYRQKRVNKN